MTIKVFYYSTDLFVLIMVVLYFVLSDLLFTFYLYVIFVVY